MGDSANAEEKCGRKLNFSTRVDRGIDVSDSDGGREFRVGKTIFLDKVVIEAVDRIAAPESMKARDKTLRS